MPDHELSASENVISLDGGLKVVGVFSPGKVTNNQTRTADFAPRQLVRWAEAIDEAYDGRVRLVFTPDSPLVGTHVDADDPDVGIGVSPIVPPADAEEINDD